MTDRNSNPRRLRPWVIGSLVALLMVLVFAFFKDEPLDDFSDLAPVEPPSAPGGVAAYEAWMAAAKTIDQSHANSARRNDPNFNDRIAGKAPWKPDPVARILDANRQPLADALAAYALGPITLPRQKSIENTPVHFGAFMQLADLLGVAMAERRQAGDLDGAFDYGLAHLRLAHTRQDQSSSLLGFIIGSSSTSLVLKHFESVLDQQTSEPVLERVATATGQAPDPIASLERSIRFEFALLAKTLDQIRRGDDDPNWFDDDAPPRFLYKPNQTHNNSADIYRAGLTQLAEAPAARPHWDPLKPPKGLARFSGNAFGDHLTNSNSVLPMMVDQADKQLASQRLLETKIALLRYRAAEGKLPAKLDELVPGYLGSSPLDPYDRQPLRHDPARGAIWSIGRNLKDEGGATVASPPSFDSSINDPTIFVQP